MASGKFTVGMVPVLLLVSLAWQGAAGESPGASRAGEPVSQPLYLTGGTDNGPLTPISPGSNSSQTAQITGSMLPRLFGTVVGNWVTNELKGTIQQGSVSTTIWAASTGRAANAGFRVNFYDSASGSLIGQIDTSRTDLSATPTKFTASGSISRAIPSGSALRVNVVYFTSSHFSSAQLLYGSTQYDTRVDVSANPFNVSFVQPKVTMDKVIFYSFVQETFGVESNRLNYTFSAAGPKAPTKELLEGPNFGGEPPQPATGGTTGNNTTQPNGTLVTWIWHYKKDKPPGGKYTETVTVTYGGNASAKTFQSAYELKFPPQDAGKKGGVFGMPGFESGGAVFAAAAVACMVWAQSRRRRRG